MTGVIYMSYDNPVRATTFRTGTTQPWEQASRRTGRPKYKWVTQTARDIWENIRNILPPHLAHAPSTLATKTYNKSRNNKQPRTPVTLPSWEPRGALKARLG